MSEGSCGGGGGGIGNEDKKIWKFNQPINCK
jgi:hypothetical protein